MSSEQIGSPQHPKVCGICCILGALIAVDFKVLFLML